MVAALVKVFLLHDFTIVLQNSAKLNSFKTRDWVAGLTHVYDRIGLYCVKRNSRCCKKNRVTMFKTNFYFQFCDIMRLKVVFDSLC